MYYLERGRRTGMIYFCEEFLPVGKILRRV